MKLKRLTLTNFRNYSNFEIEFNKDLNVIIAPNGAGKTSILDAIAIGYSELLYEIQYKRGRRYKDEILSKLKFKYDDLQIDNQNYIAPYSKIELELDEQIIWDVIKVKNNTKEIQNLVPKYVDRYEFDSYIDDIVNNHTQLPIIIYYRVDRKEQNGYKNIFKEREIYNKSEYEALNDVFDKNINFDDIVSWFIEMQNQENYQIRKLEDFKYHLPQLATVRKVIEIMLDFDNSFKILNPRVEHYSNKFIIDREIDDGSYIEFNINQLSDGYKMVLIMAMDIAMRMEKANSSLKIPLSKHNEYEALIMIDEIDLHLHPKWQQIILTNLQKAFPKAQFIVTTHSPHIISSIEKEKLFILQNGEIANSYQPTYGKPIDELLFSIFELESLRYPKVNEKITFLAKFIYSNEYTQKDFDLYLEALEKEIGKDDIAILKLKLEKLKRDKNAKD